MQPESVHSGIFVFIIKLIVVILIFGAFPAFLTLVVKNYNRKAEGIIAKQQALEDIHYENANSEVQVLSAEDARVFQNITDTVLGEWRNPLDTDYRIRFESDNSFTEYRGTQKVGFGVWRVSIERNTNSQYLSGGDLSATSDSLYSDNAKTHSDYYIVRTQFESGKKTKPQKYKIALLNGSSFSVITPDNLAINFLR